MLGNWLSCIFSIHRKWPRN